MMMMGTFLSNQNSLSPLQEIEINQEDSLISNNRVTFDRPSDIFNKKQVLR